MVEIKITGETAAKAHEEFVALSNLMLGGKLTASLSAEAIAPSRSERPPYGRGVEEPPVKEEETPVVEEEKPKRASRAKKETKPVEETKAEETPAVEEAKPVEETKTEETPVVEETKPAEEATKYEGDFAECKDDKEVLNKVRTFINTFNAVPGNSAKAKAIFATFGVRTMQNLTTEQMIEFYHKLKEQEA